MPFAREVYVPSVASLFGGYRSTTYSDSSFERIWIHQLCIVTISLGAGCGKAQFNIGVLCSMPHRMID
jgi:hypothetical protein